MMNKYEVNYDCKNEFFHSIFYNLPDLDYFLFYKNNANILNFDADSSRFATTYYLENYDVLWKTLDVKPNIRNQAQSNKNRLKYEIYDEKNKGNLNLTFRGDCMNSLWTFLRQVILLSDNKDYVYKEIGIDSKKSLGSQVNILISNIYKFEKVEKLKDPLNTYAKKSHTVSNFIPLPLTTLSTKRTHDMVYKWNLNQHRGTDPQIRDFWDLTLLCIYNWYKQDTPLLTDNPLSDILEANKTWLKAFGEGDDGWNLFVKANYLESFVETCSQQNIFGKPKMFWNDHSFDRPLPSTIEQMQDYLTNANKWISERGKVLNNLIKI